MTTNLNVSKFRNGDPIPEVKDPLEWQKAYESKQPAWCYYDNDPSYGTKYGKLYNYWTVIDSRGLSPDGWHIASYDDFEELRKFLGGTSAEVGNELKSKSGWYDYEAEITCSKCNGEGWYFQSTCSKCKGTQKLTVTYSGNGNNSTGFSALPGGYMWSYGQEFSELGSTAYFWTLGGGWKYISDDDFLNSFNSVNMVQNGLSIRCVKDTKEYIAEKEKENSKKQQQKELENLEIEFENLVKNSDVFQIYDFMKAKSNKIKELIGSRPLLVEEALFKIMKELVQSMEEDQDDRFGLTKDYFRIYESSEFIEIEKEILQLNFYHGHDNYLKMKDKVKNVDKFLSFKRKISKLKGKELSPVEKAIVGQWKFITKDKNEVLMEIKNNREMIITDLIYIKDLKIKIGNQYTTNGVWDYDGEKFNFYPEWDCGKGIFKTDNIVADKRILALNKIESKFLTSDEFSINDYKKAISKIDDITQDTRDVVSIWINEINNRDLLRNETSRLDKLLGTVSKMSEYNFQDILPIEGKKVRTDLPAIKKKVDEIRQVYTNCTKELEDIRLSVNLNLKKHFDFQTVYCDIEEKKNSNNLDKNAVKQLNIRFEGENAIFVLNEIIKGKRIK
jgi:uncharacterized protein (TIGR02145 family)